MTRFLSFVLVCATPALAASRAETTTYVEGNLTGVSPNTGGTLLFSDDKALIFRTGLATIAVPYASIGKAELGATREITHGAPVYKVWARHKKTETQFLKVEFKGDDGDQKTMTLELAQASASGVLAAIQERQGNTELAKAETPAVAAPAAAPASAPAPVVRSAPAPMAAPVTVAKSGPIVDAKDAGSKASPATKPGSDWWGDDIWKTKRNAETWTKPTGTIAPQE